MTRYCLAALMLRVLASCAQADAPCAWQWPLRFGPCVRQASERPPSECIRDSVPVGPSSEGLPALG